MARIFCVLVALVSFGSPLAAEQILYQSATLGQTGVSWDDVFNQVVPASNLGSTSFLGVRFQLHEPVNTSRIGGHFIGRPDATDESFFGAIVGLTDGDDFPDSPDLSSDDVLGTTTLNFPTVSQEVFGDISLILSPGDYALVFGSGLFGATGGGGALRNNIDIGSPEYIVDRFSNPIGPLASNYRFVLKGAIVPEPTNLVLALTALAYGSHGSRRVTRV